MTSSGEFQPHIHISALPDISKANVDFLDSSFFQSAKSPRPELPTPASIIQQYGDNGACVVKIESLNLVVKINQASYLRLEEVQTMLAIRQVFPNGEVPVPEVFGWRKYEDQVFIYMSLVHGQTLREAWSSLTVDDKRSLQSDLSQIVASIRRITQDSPHVIGTKPNPNLRMMLTRSQHLSIKAKCKIDFFDSITRRVRS
jgi:hypothetical protein